MTGLKIAMLARREETSDANYLRTKDVAEGLAGHNHSVLISEHLTNPKYQSPTEDPSQTVDRFPYSSNPVSPKHEVNLNSDWRTASSLKNFRDSLERSAKIAVLMPETGLEELSLAVHMARRGTPLIVLNDNGYFDGFKQQIEQEREFLSSLNDGNGVAIQDWDHISFVTERMSVLAQVEEWQNQGIPEKDREGRRQCEHNAHALIRHQTGVNQTDYSVHSENNRSVGTLHAGSTLEGIDRLLCDMTEPHAISVIDNSGGYHNGIIKQFDTFLDECVEKYDDIYEKVQIADDAEEAKILAAEVLSDDLNWDDKPQATAE